METLEKLNRLAFSACHIIGDNFANIEGHLVSMNRYLNGFCAYVYINNSSPYYGKTVDELLLDESLYDCEEEISYAEEISLDNKTYWKIGFSSLTDSNPVEGIYQLINILPKEDNELNICDHKINGKYSFFYRTVVITNSNIISVCTCKKCKTKFAVSLTHEEMERLKKDGQLEIMPWEMCVKEDIKK